MARARLGITLVTLLIVFYRHRQSVQKIDHVDSTAYTPPRTNPFLFSTQ